MSINVTLYKSKHAKCAHPVFVINDAPLDIWLSEQTNEDYILDLVPAQGWLYKDEEFELSWRRLKNLEPETCTFVPILVCPDDMDFSCTVIIVEQCVTEETVVWKRFGLDSSYKDEIGSTVKWFNTQASIEFSISEFKSALDKFKALFDE